MRQLRRKIVPRTLRTLIIAACHATPLAGHAGVHKTHWRIAARYFWPGMSKDIREAVLGCGHCNVANLTGHEKQHMLAGMPTAEPFDIKEGTENTIVENCIIYGSGVDQSSASYNDSNIDIKGNTTIIRCNEIYQSNNSDIDQAIMIVDRQNAGVASYRPI